MVAETQKRKFLVMEDYGMGGIWAYVLAESEEQIQNKFLEVEVFAKPPARWTKEKLARIESEGLLDIEKAASGSLVQALREDRGLS